MGKFIICKIFSADAQISAGNSDDSAKGREIS
jgi:hypothetical protein